MNVYVDPQGELGALVSHIEREGDTVVSAADEAELSIAEPLALPNEFVEDIFPTSSTGSLPSGSIQKWFLSRVWTGRDWNPQTLIVVPLQGLMNGGKGADHPVGCVLGFCEPCAELGAYFDLKPLVALNCSSNDEDGHRIGFTSLAFVGVDSTPKSIILGLPPYGLYAAMECLKDQKISSWHVEPRLLREQWACALLLTRYPWPMWEEDEKVGFEISGNQEKHLWLFPGVQRFKNGGSTHKTRVGVSTAWSPVVGQACSRPIETLDRLRIPQSQYRTDAKRTLVETLGPVVKAGLVRMVTEV